ncbi:MAG: hypothetical protein ACRCSZ_06285 [Lactococcus lactis]
MTKLIEKLKELHEYEVGQEVWYCDDESDYPKLVRVLEVEKTLRYKTSNCTEYGISANWLFPTKELALKSLEGKDEHS